MKFAGLITMADRLQLYRYVVHNVAASYGKTATFMAKPMFADNGSGMHVHQSIWNKGKPLFAGDKYAGLSQICLWYIGGIIKHAKAINAFTNSTISPYKRTVPGYEAPVKLAYSAHPATRPSIRIRPTDSPKGKRIEVKVSETRWAIPTSASPPERAKPRRHRKQDRSGRPRRQEPLRLAAARAKVPEVCGSLKEALDALDKDRAFLKKGAVAEEATSSTPTSS